MTVPTLAAIPTLGRSEWLSPLTWQLHQEAVDRIVVFDNGAEPPLMLHEDNPLQARTEIVDARRLPFYAMWNTAICLGRAMGVANVAVLNDDIELPPWTLATMVDALRSQPDIGIVSPAGENEPPSGNGIRDVTGTYKDHGINGACFAIRAEACPLIDERFEYWYGDDDLVAKILASGQRAVVIDGLSFTHHRSTSLDTIDGVHDAFARDADRWKELHPT